MAAYSLSSPEQKNLLCEFYLCNYMLQKNTGFMINLYVGESQLNAFVSLLQNQIAWKERESKFLLKASSTGLCMRAHYGKPSTFLTHFRTHAFDKRFKTHYPAILQKSIDAFTSYEEEKFEDIYEGCSKRWELLTVALKRREVISPTNLIWSLERAKALCTIIPQVNETYSQIWMGMQTRPPLLLTPMSPWQNREPQDPAEFEKWERKIRKGAGYSTSELKHWKIQYQPFDLSNQMECRTYDPTFEE
ncbi:hypothetical protein KI387_038830 [Taxus chinensis]|uniref:Uncharacterized protein n=1 Tax=Taxus chinensis TaxID=29808 RepID=A0AA38FB99_TAXCH|nr:hypothetical protein KI387_038830 [Taxus chinensis]